MNYQRKLSLERGSIGTDGAFPMTLATQGEAVDGHILRVRGIELGESLPLQVDHNPSARANVGIIDGFSVNAGSRSTPDALRAQGRIRTSGSGEGLDLRRDLIDAIDVGDITGVSLRWQGLEVVERTALPKGHAAHVKRSEADPRLRYGLFFEKSRGLEGSIVGIGSDRASMIGRSESAASETLATFWHSMAGESDSIPERMVEIVDELEGELSTLRERLLEFERQQESDTPSAVDDDSAEIKSGLRMDLVTEVIGEAFARMEAQNIEQFRALEKDLKHGQIRRHPQR